MASVLTSRVKRISVVVAAALVVSSALVVCVVRHDLGAAVLAEKRHEVQTASLVLGMLIGEHGQVHALNAKLASGPRPLDETAIVDKVKSLSGADATIFSYRNGVFTRTATTLRRDGVRIVGTNLAGPALEAVNASGHFSGVSPVLGRAYLNDYEAIRDPAGMPIGIFYTGIPLSDLEAAVTNAFVQTGVIMLTVLIGLVVLTVLLTRPLTCGLATVTAGLQSIVHDDFTRLIQAYGELERGDLSARFTAHTQTLQTSGNDEISLLAHAYNALSAGLVQSGAKFEQTTVHLHDALSNVVAAATKLREMSVLVSRSTEESGMAIRDIAQGVGAVAAGAAEQSNGMSSVSIAIQELAHTSTEIAQGAHNQANLIKSAGNAVAILDEQIGALAQLGSSLTVAAHRATSESVTGAAAVAQTASAMTRIREEADTTNAAMARLVEQSNAVENIVSTIDEISDQTNLLALNATIEAARAGENGRGFAVVADEVGKLAGRAATSTREINAIVAQIRLEVNFTGEAVRRSIAATEAGSARIEAATSALGNLDSAITHAAEIADQMAASTTAMRDASAHVTIDVSGVSAVVEENAVASQRLQATSEMVTSAIVPIAELAMRQSAAASAVAQSAEVAGSRVHAIANAADDVRQQAEILTISVARFELSDTAFPTAKTRELRPYQSVD